MWEGERQIESGGITNVDLLIKLYILTRRSSTFAISEQDCQHSQAYKLNQVTSQESEDCAGGGGMSMLPAGLTSFVTFCLFL